MRNTLKPSSANPNSRFSSLLPVALALALALPLLTIACGDRGAGGQEPAATVADAGASAEAPVAAPEDQGAAAGEPAGAAADIDQPLPAEAAPEPTAAELAERQRRLQQQASEVAAREAAVTAREAEVARRQEEEARAERQAAAPPAPPPAPVADPEPAYSEPPPPPEVRRVSVSLPVGTSLDVELLDTVSSATSQAGDTFRSRLTAAARDAEGRLVLPAGTEVLGMVTEAVPLKKVGGKAMLGLRFTDVVLPDGETAPLTASLLEQGKSETGRDAATIGGAAAGGAILGRILDRGDKKRGTVLGAILGAAAGTAIASKTEGEEVEMPAGSVLRLWLDERLRLTVPEDW